MEKNCLVTQLKSKTGNTDLPVMGFIKIRISYISELNDEPWNIFGFYPIEGKTVTIKILGEGYIYTNSSNRETNTDGMKSITINDNRGLFFSNGDYEILIEKYTIKGINSGGFALRSDNIHFDYKTFENSNLARLNIQFSRKEGVLKYPLNISGSIKSLPSTITEIFIFGDNEHLVQLEDLAPIATSLKSFSVSAWNHSSGSFDDVKFNKVMSELYIAYADFTGNLENVPIAINSNINYGKNYFYGNVREPIERMAKNATTTKDVYLYVESNRNNIFWRDMVVNDLPNPGWLYLTLDGTGGVTVYGDEARTNLLGSFDGTTWSYPS